MGSSINEDDLVELETSLFKTRIKYPVFYNIVFVLNVMFVLACMYLFYNIL